MLSRILGLALCVLATSCFSACAPISFGKQELALRHDAKANAVDLLIVYDEIEASGEAQSSYGFATRVSGGKREFMIYDWPLHFDLDGLAKKVAEEAEDEISPWRDWKREMLSGVQGVKVEHSGYFAGENGRLGLFQSLHFADAAHWIKLIERALYVGIEESVAAGTFESDFKLLDAHSRELWIAMAKDKRNWLSLQEGALVVDLPISGACAGRLVAEILRRSGEDADFARFFAGLASHLSDMNIAQEHVVLRWKLDGPTFTLEAPKSHEYNDQLAKTLRESKSLPEKLITRESVLHSFFDH